MIYSRYCSALSFIACLTLSFLGFSGAQDEEGSSQSSPRRLLSRESSGEERILWTDQRRARKDRQRKRFEPKKESEPCFTHSPKGRLIKDRRVSPGIQREVSHDILKGFEGEDFQISGDWVLADVTEAKDRFYYSLSLVEQIQKNGDTFLEGPIFYSRARGDWRVFLDASFSFPKEEGIPCEVGWEEGEAGISPGLAIKAESFFLELPSLLRITHVNSLDLSRCSLTSSQLSSLFDSVGFLTHLDLSHNNLVRLPVSLETWLWSYRSRYLTSFDMGHNPWKGEAVKAIRRSLRKKRLKILGMQNVGLEGGWDALEGFFEGGVFPGLTRLDLTGNRLSVATSSLLCALSRKHFFSLVMTPLRIEVREWRKKEREDQQRNTTVPEVQILVGGKNKTHTLSLPREVSLDKTLVRRLMDSDIKHLKILRMEPETLTYLLRLRNLQTLSLESDQMTELIDEIRDFVLLWKDHRHLSTLILNNGGDMSLGAAEALIQEMTKPKRLSSKQKSMVRRLTKQINALSSEDSLTKERRKKKSLIEQKEILEGTRPVTIVLPLLLEQYRERLEEKKAEHITLRFE